MTDTAQQKAAAENPNQMAPSPGVDWMNVVADMANEHVARLAVDASVLRVKLAQQKTAYTVLHGEHQIALRTLEEFADRCGALEQENASLADQLEQAQVPAVRAPAKKSTRGRRAS